MSATDRTPRDSEVKDDPEPVVTTVAEPEAARPTGPAADWQVLLLRYLPQPAGSTHLIKRLTPR
jgi:hypothetical protein